MPTCLFFKEPNSPICCSIHKRWLAISRPVSGHVKQLTSGKLHLFRQSSIWFHRGYNSSPGKQHIPRDISVAPSWSACEHCHPAGIHSAPHRLFSCGSFFNRISARINSSRWASFRKSSSSSSSSSSSPSWVLPTAYSRCKPRGMHIRIYKYKQIHIYIYIYLYL